MSLLRTRIIRLAHERVELRSVLLPILKEAMEFPTEEALAKYLKEHPDADKSKHKVKKTEKSDEGGGEPDSVRLPKEQSHALGELIGPWSSGGDILGQVGSHLYGGHPVPKKKLQEALGYVGDLIPKAEAGANGWTKADVKDLKKIEKGLKSALK